ncbi:hypothetical protein B0H10DRAFT_1225857 [Mycena sp. CBHHK59/15]|nr:hypothetical protein B0H10DRAFT_1225857 [Mycena sp. CBHHK59/15]
MAWRCSGKTNTELVENIVKSKILNSTETQVNRIAHVCDERSRPRRLRSRQVYSL